jgi:hypothetical protein
MTEDLNAIELDTSTWPDALYEKSLIFSDFEAKIKIFDSEEGFIILVETENGGAIIDLIPEYEDAIERCETLAEGFSLKTDQEED